MGRVGTLRRVVWRCTIACVALQAILALVMLQTMFDLSTYGEVARRPTYSWAGLMLPLASAAGAGIAVQAAWRARRAPGASASLAMGQALMLLVGGTLAALFQRAPATSARAVLLVPGSRLPPNEIYGSEWALGGIIGPLLAVGKLAVVGLLLAGVLGIADRRGLAQEVMGPAP